jgi:hypothetical protein
LVRAQRRAGHCMSPSWLRAVPPSMFSIMPRSRRGRRQRRAGLRPHYHANYYAATATISKPYATALNESRRTRPPGGELMNCLLRPATAGDLASNLVAMSAVGTTRKCCPPRTKAAHGSKADSGKPCRSVFMSSRPSWAQCMNTTFLHRPGPQQSRLAARIMRE